MQVCPGDDDLEPELRLWGMWRGTRSQLMSLGIWSASQRLPLTKEWLSVPMNSPQSWRPLVCGEVEVIGDQISYTVDFGEPPLSIDARGDVEVVFYLDEVAYHGTLEALLAIGIDKRRLPTGTRSVRRNENCWDYPDCQ